MLRYRAEIDGLRTIAVVAVVLFHAQFSHHGRELFGGGFVGVDIFFVISGYLITGLLLRDMQDGRFSILKFYERRVRRILPALFVVIAVSAPFAVFLMLPKAFFEYLQSLVATLLFSSNVLFWLQDSYTAEPSALKPFLHTWSLGVEEQFYLFFPPLLFLCFFYARRALPAVLGGALVLSFALTLWCSRDYPDASFYFLPMRMWELLTGSLLALRERMPLRSPVKWQKNYLPIMGLCFILAAVFLYSGTMPILGIIPAVVGTALIIAFAGETDFATKVLRLKPMVGVGLVSYSFYLWHQPVFAFFRIPAVKPVDNGDRLGLIALSLILGILSWWFVERPFRNSGKISPKRLWVFAGAANAIVLMGCAAAIISMGLPRDLPPIARHALDGLKQKPALQQSGSACLGRAVKEACNVGDPSASMHWVLAGDSHLDNLSAALASATEQQHSRLTVLTTNACPYIEGVSALVDGVSKYCVPSVNQDRAAYLTQNGGSYVVLGGRMPLYLERRMFDNGEGGIEKTNDIFLQVADPSSADTRMAISRAFAKTVHHLLQQGHRVVLLYPIPEVGWHVPHKFVQDLPRSFNKIDEWVQSQGVTTSFPVYQQRSKSTFALYDSLPDDPNLLRIYPDKLFCNTRLIGRCVTHDQQALFYVDDDQLSLAGAKLVVDEIMAQSVKVWPQMTKGKIN